MATRRERVVLELQDDFTAGALRAAAATELLDKRLNSLGGRAVQTSRAQRDMNTSMGDTGKTAGGSSREIDRFSGRVRLLADVAAILGPSLIPIGAVGIPAVTGLASAFAGAAVGAGTAVIAFQGVADGLKALNKAYLEPTASNLEAADEAMRKLGPDARSLIRHLHGLTGEWRNLRDAAASGLFPGVERALDDLITRSPEVERILNRVGEALGNVATNGASSIAGPRWDDFFNFIGKEAPVALSGLAAATGNLAHAGAELFMAFDPLNDDFLQTLVIGTDQIDKWATGLSKTKGFQEFVAYIQANGPQVGQTLGAIAMAFLDIIEAAAPLGGPTLKLLEAVADLVSAIADSPFGPSIMAGVTALSIFNRSLAVTESLGKRAWVQNVKGAEGFSSKVGALAGPLGKAAAAAGGLALGASSLGDNFEFANTASLGLVGTLGGPWGAAAGAAVGLFLDLTKSSGGFEISADQLTDTLNRQTGAITERTKAFVADQLYSQGVLDSARDLGLSLADVTDAALGNADALYRVNAGLDAGNAAMRDSNGQLVVGTEVWQKFKTSSDDVTGAIGKTSGALHDAQGRVAAVGEALGHTAGKADDAKTALERFADAVTRANALLSKRASFRDYQQALDDFTKGLKENGKSLDINTQKGRDNQANLDNIAQTALKVAEKLKGTDRVQALRQAREDFVDAAGKLGKTRDEAIKLANHLGLVGRIKAKPEVDADTSTAEAKINKVQQQLNGLHDKTIFLTTVLQTRTDHQESRLPHRASGGPVLPCRPYVVGEHHPELFVPEVSGRILPTVPATYARTAPGSGGSGGGSPSGSDAVGLLGQILAALTASDLGPGMLRSFAKAMDEIQRGLAKNKGTDDLRGQAHDLLKDIREAEKDRNRAIRDAFRSLETDLEQGAATIRDELTDLKRSLKEAGGVWDDALRKHAARILELAKQYDRQSAKLERQQGVLDVLINGQHQMVDEQGRILTQQDGLVDLLNQQSQLVSQAQGNFQHDPFGNGLAGFFTQMSADTNDASAFNSVLQQLSAMGLDGGAFQALAASGDLNTAQQLLAAGAGGISQFEGAFAARDAALTALGDTVGASMQPAIDAMSAQITNQNALIDRTQSTMHDLQQAVNRQEKLLRDLAGIGKDVEHGAEKGVRAGMNDQDRRTGQMARV